MAYRKFDTGTWHDKLKPFERYLFIYLWTNDLCNQAGLYEITLRRIEFDTKIPSTQVEPLLNGISTMVHYWPDFEVVFIKNFTKRQCQNKQFADGALNIVAERYPRFLQLWININKSLLEKQKITLPGISENQVQPPFNPPSTSTEQNRTVQNRTELKKGDQPFRLPDKEILKEGSERKILADIETVVEKLYEAKMFPSVHAFKNTMLKKHKNPRAVLHALSRCYLKKEFDGDPWAYCEKIMQVENGNYNESDYQKTAS